MLELAAMSITGYLCGSVASAILVCRALRLPDPRAGGSGNPGATNVLRLGGKGAAGLTLAGDVLKGVIPVLLARVVSADPMVHAAAAVSAFAGHLYPVFFRFQGGRGVATSFGAIGALAWPVALGMGLIWVVTAALGRFSSLASLAAGLSAPALAALFAPDPSYLAGLAAISVLLVWRHRDNIKRLRAGTEPRIGERRTDKSEEPRNPPIPRN